MVRPSTRRAVHSAPFSRLETEGSRCVACAPRHLEIAIVIGTAPSTIPDDHTFLDPAFGRFLEVADGVIVGSGLKVDGQTWNPVDPARVTAFMEAVRAAREPHAQPAA
jgi:hypothetical protein